MNWQTTRIEDYLLEIEVLNTERRSASQVQKLVESNLLKIDNINCTDELRNFAILAFLKNVDWEELVINPYAWDEYESGYQAYLKEFGIDE